MTPYALKKQLDDLSLVMPDHTSSDINFHLNELVKTGGKKFRPGLLFVFGELLNLPEKELIPYARAVELTHLASLVHDDVIDESLTRRHHQTLNALKDNTTAVLAGDYILSTVMGELATLNKPQLLIDLTEAIKMLADGEWLQYNLKKKAEVQWSDLVEISIKKTGSLIAWCATTPAQLAGRSELSSYRMIGEKIGLVFQMADDMIDAFEVNGRPCFLDYKNGQLNFVTQKLSVIKPELKASIYENKGTENYPWERSQYEEALKAVHQEIDKEIKEIFTIFESTSSTLNSSVKDVFEKMILKIQDNYLQYWKRT